MDRKPYIPIGLRKMTLNFLVNLCDVDVSLQPVPSTALVHSSSSVLQLEH